MTTLTLIVALLGGTAICLYLFDKAKQEMRRSGRLGQRLQQYLDSLPPKQPW